MQTSPAVSHWWITDLEMGSSVEFRTNNAVLIKMDPAIALQRSAVADIDDSDQGLI
jgi:hypothetical protein